MTISPRSVPLPRARELRAERGSHERPSRHRGAGWLAISIAKGILGKEIQGQIERRVSASVDATIASLPADLREEWEEEWRAELAAVICMPMTASVYARGLRRGARQLSGTAAAAGAQTRASRGLDRIRLGVIRHWDIAATVIVQVVGLVLYMYLDAAGTAVMLQFATLTGFLVIEMAMVFWVALRRMKRREQND